MSDKLQAALAQLIDKANTGVDTAADFLTAEIPSVVQQLLLWHGVYSFAMFLLGLLCLWGAYKLWGTIPEVLSEPHSTEEEVETSKYWKLGLYETAEIQDATAARLALNTIAGSILFLVAVFHLNLTWLQIWIAPKVWLIEYAANLTN